MPERDRRNQRGNLQQQVDLLEQLDKKLVTLFAEKKKELTEKMKQAQNQKRLLAYSR